MRKRFWQRTLKTIRLMTDINGGLQVRLHQELLLQILNVLCYIGIVLWIVLGVLYRQTGGFGITK